MEEVLGAGGGAAAGVSGGVRPLRGEGAPHVGERGRAVRGVHNRRAVGAVARLVERRDGGWGWTVARGVLLEAAPDDRRRRDLEAKLRGVSPR